jgi:hypothetical protein
MSWQIRPLILIEFTGKVLKKPEYQASQEV